MKTINIHLPDVEVAMLAEVQKKKARLKTLDRLVIDIVRGEYFRLFKNGCVSGLT